MRRIFIGSLLLVCACINECPAAEESEVTRDQTSLRNYGSPSGIKNAWQDTTKKTNWKDLSGTRKRSHRSFDSGIHRDTVTVLDSRNETTELPTTTQTQAATVAPVSNSTATTTALAATTVIPTSATTLAPGESIPSYDDAFYHVLLSCEINFLQYTDDLGDPDSIAFNQFSRLAEHEMDLIFEEYTGDPNMLSALAGWDHIVVNEYYPQSPTRVRRSKPTMRASPNVSTIANFTILYQMEAMLQSIVVSDMFAFINDTFLEQLKNTTIPYQGFNYPINQDYIDDTTKGIELPVEESRIDEEVNNPCLNYFENLCPNPCEACTNPSTPRVALCVTACLESDFKTCFTPNQTDRSQDECRCIDKYLYFQISDRCINQNVIIGTVVGIGGALLLGLTIGLIIANKRRKAAHALVDAIDRDVMIRRPTVPAQQQQRGLALPRGRAAPSWQALYSDEALTTSDLDNAGYFDAEVQSVATPVGSDIIDDEVPGPSGLQSFAS